MRIGYTRVSTLDQSLKRQIEELKSAKCDIIYQDKISGASRSRPELDKLIASLAPGDTVIIVKLDRLGRSLKHLMDLIEIFDEKKVHFISLGEAIDTTTPAGELLFHLIGAIAQFERAIILQRVRSGIKSAKANGVKFGRRVSLDYDQIKVLKSSGLSVSEIANEMEITRKSVYRALKPTTV